MSPTRWTGYVQVVSSTRNRARLRDRLSAMAASSTGLHLAFSPNLRLGTIRSGGTRGAIATLEWVAVNDDENRIPTDIGRKIRDAMGDAEVGVSVVTDEAAS